jgi:thiol-disulfide isomerase/thioredoxin
VTRLIPAVLFLAAATVTADDRPPTPAEKLAALQNEQAVAERAYFRVLEAMSGTPGARKYDELWEPFDAGQAARFAAAVELAKADPKSDLALSALEFVLSEPRSYYLPAGLPALELVAAHHAANPKVGKIVAWLGSAHGPSKRDAEEAHAVAQKLIAAVAEKNPDRTARAQAHVGLAWQKIVTFYAAQYKRAPDTEKLAAEAEAAYETLARDYGDCRRLHHPDASSVGTLAASQLHELRHLRVGKVAPDIQGEGVDGAKLKLSDFRGKVTVLVFWASWCGPCMQEVPHERELVARLKDKPFALVGMNADMTRQEAGEVMAKRKMTWPSFWDGDLGPDGPISKAWNVYAWPTVYVLDAKGVIRFKHVVRKDLDNAVDELLKEMEAAKK